MSDPATGIVKCPHCEKYFITVTGIRSIFMPDDPEGKAQTERLIEIWKNGARECPYCLKVLSANEWKACITDELRPCTAGKDYVDPCEAIKKKQGSLKFGKLL
jgi:uncharacterized Zn-finger protein